MSAENKPKGLETVDDKGLCHLYIINRWYRNSGSGSRVYKAWINSLMSNYSYLQLAGAGKLELLQVDCCLDFIKEHRGKYTLRTIDSHVAYMHNVINSGCNDHAKFVGLSPDTSLWDAPESQQNLIILWEIQGQWKSWITQMEWEYKTSKRCMTSSQRGEIIRMIDVGIEESRKRFKCLETIQWLEDWLDIFLYHANLDDDVFLGSRAWQYIHSCGNAEVVPGPGAPPVEWQHQINDFRLRYALNFDLRDIMSCFQDAAFDLEERIDILLPKLSRAKENNQLKEFRKLLKRTTSAIKHYSDHQIDILARIYARDDVNVPVMGTQDRKELQKFVFEQVKGHELLKSREIIIKWYNTKVVPAIKWNFIFVGYLWAVLAHTSTMTAWRFLICYDKDIHLSDHDNLHVMEDIDLFLQLLNNFLSDLKTRGKFKKKGRKGGQKKKNKKSPATEKTEALGEKFQINTTERTSDDDESEASVTTEDLVPAIHSKETSPGIPESTRLENIKGKESDKVLASSTKKHLESHRTAAGAKGKGKKPSKRSLSMKRTELVCPPPSAESCVRGSKYIAGALVKSPIVKPSTKWLDEDPTTQSGKEEEALDAGSPQEKITEDDRSLEVETHIVSNVEDLEDVLSAMIQKGKARIEREWLQKRRDDKAQDKKVAPAKKVKIDTKRCQVINHTDKECALESSGPGGVSDIRIVDKEAKYEREPGAKKTTTSLGLEVSGRCAVDNQTQNAASSTKETTIKSLGSENSSMGTVNNLINNKSESEEDQTIEALGLRRPSSDTVVNPTIGTNRLKKHTEIKDKNIHQPLLSPSPPPSSDEEESKTFYDRWDELEKEYMISQRKKEETIPMQTNLIQDQILNSLKTLFEEQNKEGGDKTVTSSVIIPLADEFHAVENNLTSSKTRDLYLHDNTKASKINLKKKRERNGKKVGQVFSGHDELLPKVLSRENNKARKNMLGLPLNDSGQPAQPLIAVREGENPNETEPEGSVCEENRADLSKERTEGQGQDHWKLLEKKEGPQITEHHPLKISETPVISKTRRCDKPDRDPPLKIRFKSGGNRRNPEKSKFSDGNERSSNKVKKGDKVEAPVIISKPKAEVQRVKKEAQKLNMPPEQKDQTPSLDRTSRIREYEKEAESQKAKLGRSPILKKTSLANVIPDNTQMPDSPKTSVLSIIVPKGALVLQTSTKPIRQEKLKDTGIQKSPWVPLPSVVELPKGPIDHTKQPPWPAIAGEDSPLESPPNQKPMCTMALTGGVETMAVPRNKNNPQQSFSLSAKKAATNTPKHSDNKSVPVGKPLLGSVPLLAKEPTNLNQLEATSSKQTVAETPLRENSLQQHSNHIEVVRKEANLQPKNEEQMQGPPNKDPGPPQSQPRRKGSPGYRGDHKTDPNTSAKCSPRNGRKESHQKIGETGGVECENSRTYSKMPLPVGIPHTAEHPTQETVHQDSSNVVWVQKGHILLNQPQKTEIKKLEVGSGTSGKEERPLVEQLTLRHQELTQANDLIHLLENTSSVKDDIISLCSSRIKDLIQDRGALMQECASLRHLAQTLTNGTPEKRVNASMQGHQCISTTQLRSAIISPSGLIENRPVPFRLPNGLTESKHGVHAILNGVDLEGDKWQYENHDIPLIPRHLVPGEKDLPPPHTILERGDNPRLGQHIPITGHIQSSFVRLVYGTENRPNPPNERGSTLPVQANLQIPKPTMGLTELPPQDMPESAQNHNMQHNLVQNSSPHSSNLQSQYTAVQPASHLINTSQPQPTLVDSPPLLRSIPRPQQPLFQPTPIRIPSPHACLGQPQYTPTHMPSAYPNLPQPELILRSAHTPLAPRSDRWPQQTQIQPAPIHAPLPRPHIAQPQSTLVNTSINQNAPQPPTGPPLILPHNNYLQPYQAPPQYTRVQNSARVGAYHRNRYPNLPGGGPQNYYQNREIPTRQIQTAQVERAPQDGTTSSPVIVNGSNQSNHKKRRGSA